jgi:hypothetical protein
MNITITLDLESVIFVTAALTWLIFISIWTYSRLCLSDDDEDQAPGKPTT